MVVPPGGFGKRLDAMHDWHRAHNIEDRRGTGRREEDRNIIRWCVADQKTAADFAVAFGGMVANMKDDDDRTIKRYPRGTAYHEAGHAIVAWSLGLLVQAVRVSDDDASGGAEIGGADQLPLIEHIAVCSGGIAAEAVFGHLTHDLAFFDDHARICDLLEDAGISEEDGQGKARRDEGYDFARARLETHRNSVIRLADRLVERGHVDGPEFLRLVNGEET